MSCKYCSAIGEVKSFLDDPSKWCSADEFGKKVQELRQKENMAREEIPKIIDKEMRMNETKPAGSEQEHLGSYKEAPWADENIIHESENLIVYKDGYPVTEGHLLFVPKKVEHSRAITRCFEVAYEWGVRGILDRKWDAFNVGINNGVAAGQSVMWPHIHLIPRREGDTPKPKGGVRHVIPLKGDY